MKECGRCHITKPFDAFFKDASTRDGYRSPCKECRVEDDKKSRQRYYEKNKPQIRQQQKIGRQEHPEWEQTKRERHREKIRARNQKRKKDNPEAVKVSTRRYYKSNKEQIDQYNRQWALAHPEETKAIRRRGRARRRARSLNLPATFSASDEHFARAYWHDTCAVCRRVADKDYVIAMDHWIPIASTNCPGTIATNMIPLCHSRKGGKTTVPNCNQSKNCKDPLIWLTERWGIEYATSKQKEIEMFFSKVTQQETSSKGSTLLLAGILILIQATLSASADAATATFSALPVDALAVQIFESLTQVWIPIIALLAIIGLAIAMFTGFLNIGTRLAGFLFGMGLLGVGLPGIAPLFGPGIVTGFILP